MDWIQLNEDRAQLRGVVKTVSNLWVL